MVQISFNTDSLSDQLKQLNPSSIELKSPKIKTASISSTIAAATPDIAGKITNAVDNFKNLKTGAIPTGKLPNIDTSAFLEPIDLDLQKNLSDLKSVKGKMDLEQKLKSQNFDTQLENIKLEGISSAEVNKFQGNMFKDIKTNISNITNTQVLNFVRDPVAQQTEILKITADVVSKAKEQAETAVSDAAAVEGQIKSINSLEGLVDKKNIFI